ncbi:hypothetical protein [Mesorhizobium sp. WSM3224]|uniref:hypothetical protein n=1 Tax=Mesorhizobium sp. WSM3224 TaxID=1040986 RepID=UPI0004283D80|nr:hypothetical protein [Mesorhizobium sp. WSM3224]
MAAATPPESAGRDETALLAICGYAAISENSEALGARRILRYRLMALEDRIIPDITA